MAGQARVDAYNHRIEEASVFGGSVEMKRGRVVLAMSGGVDSSVSAYLLLRAGYDVVGLFMRTGAHDEANACDNTTTRHRGCCSAIDADDGRRVADQLGLPFYALNFEKEFGRIKDYFVDEYLRGRTPNPCVVCNTWLKFGKLWHYARSIGADYIATGHYARIVRSEDNVALHMAIDVAKDQSYFLFGLDRELFDRIVFPVGAMLKREVRSLAAELGLAVSNKPDSQEVCFVPDGDSKQFIRRHRPEASISEGEVVDQTGAVVGKHSGFAGYTIGQRRGLGVALGEPRYVIGLSPDENRVVIGPRELLACHQLEADGVNWLTQSPPTSPVRCTAKIRYRHEPADVTVIPAEDNRVRVRFDVPQYAVTPGQAAVFYDGSRVLGGGWIR